MTDIFMEFPALRRGASVAGLLSCLCAGVALAADPLPDIGPCEERVKAFGAPEYKGDAPESLRLCRAGYYLSHNHGHRTPDWVVEWLDPSRFTGPGDRKEQGDPFKPDPNLEPAQRADLPDYKKSGYDRGHMAPAADMKFTEVAMAESFYLSNMSPQVGPKMNRGIWADLEGLTREWTCERGELVVMTGPIYGTSPKTIGANQVAVPTAFYKIAYDPARSRAIAFVLPNQSVDKGKQAAWEVLKEYVVSIGDVEEMVGIDFLPKLKPRVRNRLEGLKSVMWPVRTGCPG